jgi:hypothetical protein
MVEKMKTGSKQLAGAPQSTFINNLFDSADLSGFETDFDAMRMMGRFCQNIFHNAARRLSGALILF